MRDSASFPSGGRAPGVSRLTASTWCVPKGGFPRSQKLIARTTVLSRCVRHRAVCCAAEHWTNAGQSNRMLHAEFRTAYGDPMSLAYELHSIETISEAALRGIVSSAGSWDLMEASPTAAAATGDASVQPAQRPNGYRNFLKRWPSSIPLSGARDLRQAAPQAEYDRQEAEALLRRYDERFSGGPPLAKEPQRGESQGIETAPESWQRVAIPADGPQEAAAQQHPEDSSMRPTSGGEGRPAVAAVDNEAAAAAQSTLGGGNGAASELRTPRRDAAGEASLWDSSQRRVADAPAAGGPWETADGAPIERPRVTKEPECLLVLGGMGARGDSGWFRHVVEHIASLRDPETGEGAAVICTFDSRWVP